MSRPNYRVLLSYDGERKVFLARIPELPPCIGEGATRSEAIANMERELDALLQNLGDSGSRIPGAIDDLPAGGELSVKVSRSLQRDLAFQAQLEGVELGQFVAELLAAGLEHRLRSGRPQRRPHPNEAGGDEGPRRDDRSHGNERTEHRGDHRNDQVGRWQNRNERERNNAARFHGLLEDRASFMEYVRGLESEGGHGNHRGPRPGGGPGGGGGYDNRGGRGRGFQGPGPGGGGRGERPNRDRGPERGAGPNPGRGPGGAGGSEGGSSGSAPST